MLMSDKTYDYIKSVALVILPAIAVLYATLAGLWGFPNPVAVVGTIDAIDVFLGALLKLASKYYREHPNEDDSNT